MKDRMERREKGGREGELKKGKGKRTPRPSYFSNLLDSRMNMAIAHEKRKKGERNGKWEINRGREGERAGSPHLISLAAQKLKRKKKKEKNAKFLYLTLRDGGRGGGGGGGKKP